MKNTRWLWYYWPLALVFIAFVLFGIPEYAAIRWGGPTFSEFMATVADAGPIGKIWTFCWGLLIGTLLSHFVGWKATSEEELARRAEKKLAQSKETPQGPA